MRILGRQLKLAANSSVTLKVYDLLGSSVATLVNGAEQAGSHTARFNAAGLASGVYFARKQAGSFVQVRKMLFTTQAGLEGRIGAISFGLADRQKNREGVRFFPDAGIL